MLLEGMNLWFMSGRRAVKQNLASFAIQLQQMPHSRARGQGLQPLILEWVVPKTSLINLEQNDISSKIEYMRKDTYGIKVAHRLPIAILPAHCTVKLYHRHGFAHGS